MRKNRFGLSVALSTPFTEHWAIDLPRLVAHARQSLADGCTSVTAFGTTGEGASLGLNERQRALGALAGAGIDPRTKLIVGIAAASVEDAVAQGRAGLMVGCPNFLLAPPFYFKGAGDEGLFDWFGAVLTVLGPAASNVILYHIPQVTSVGLSIELIDRLKKAFPQQVTGVKDSSGDWAYTQSLLAAHKDIAILIGDERYLAEGVSLGGQGAISGLANVCPEILLAMIETKRGDTRVNRLVDEVLRHPVTPAVKALVAHRTGADEWRHVRAPLVAMQPGTGTALSATYDKLFDLKAA